MLPSIKIDEWKYIVPNYDLPMYMQNNCTTVEKRRMDS
jgi:hypothetical protein